jgi:hypothetical protein
MLGRVPFLYLRVKGIAELPVQAVQLLHREEKKLHSIED